MKKLKVEVNTQGGLHARPASEIVNLLKSYDSDVKIKKDNQDKMYNAKSMMGILSMGASNGTMLEFIIDGSDEDIVYKNLEEFLTKTFVA